MKDGSLIQYYSDRAQEYERIYGKPERQADLARLRSTVSEMFANRDVLEVACGTGYWTEVLAASAASVTALDVNEKVLEIARGKPGNAGVDFRSGDAYALPRDRLFSGALAVFWWSHVPKERLEIFLEGFHATLAPGGIVCFLDNRYVEGNSTPLSRVDEERNSYQIRALDDGSKHEVLKNFPTEEELRMAVAPWASEIKVEWAEYYWMLKYFAK